MDFFNLVCQRGENAPPCAVDGWVQGLPKIFPASLFKDTQWGFAVFEAVHILGLFLLGGCVIMLNLRLLGVGIREQAPPDLERNLRPWLWTGTLMVLLTGILIGMLNPEKLYTSPAFFAKMVAMVAALIFSFGVTNHIARAEGAKPGPVVLGAAAAAFLLWLWSIGVFGTAVGANPGSIHMIVAGYAILLAFGRIPARFAAVGLAVILVGIYVVQGYLVLGGPYGKDYNQFMNLAKMLVDVAAVGLVALLGFEIFAGRTGETGPIVKLVALFSILSWVTVGAAGRWIGLS